MTRQHRYRQEALGQIPGAEAHDYSPQGLELAKPEQGQLALDGSVLGPLFDQPEKQGQETGEQGCPKSQRALDQIRPIQYGQGEW